MEQTGEYRIPAPIEAVWSALNDADVLCACIDGCESLTKIDDEHFEASVKVKLGPVRAAFKANIELVNLNPPQSYTLNLDVKGGAAGFGRGTADVELCDTGDGTRLNYGVHASVGGKIAQIGSRLIDATARKMADSFFNRFAQSFGGSFGGQAEAEGASSGAREGAKKGAKQSGSESKRRIWLAAAVLAVVVVFGAAWAI